MIIAAAVLYVVGMFPAAYVLGKILGDPGDGPAALILTACWPFLLVIFVPSTIFAKIARLGAGIK